MTDIRGEPRPLDEYRGKVVLMVNVASECGLTPQYEDLQGLHEKYGEQGLVVLGFPANDFKGQEPGTDEEILEFCTREYKVSFPMFSKISVIGEDRHPLYAKLAAAMSEQGGEPTWNFTKYLVDRTGHVVKRIDPKTEP
ncbi:MAG TPA: glutathione peroxidase, partial [Phycisphaerales bacterium]|nr:glutathione peroxidase [Phycisphaerales bacterium]